MLRGLTRRLVACCGLLLAACAPAAAPSVTVQTAPAPPEVAGPVPLLPLVLAAPSAPIFPLEGPAGARRPEAPEVVELPASSWELPASVRMRPLAQLSPEAARFLAKREHHQPEFG